MGGKVLFNLVLGMGQAILLEGALDLLGVGIRQPQPARVLGNLRRAPQMPQADGLEEILVLVDAIKAHAQEAVLAGELANAAEILVARTGARPLDALVQVVHQVVLADSQKRLVHSQIDGLALPRLLSLVQGGQSRACDHERVEVVAGIGPRQHRLLLGTVLHDDPGIGHNRQIVGRALDHLGIARLAEAGHVHDDELRVHGPQHFVGQALARPRAALRSLHEDVRISDHVEEYLTALFGEVVQRHGTLVAALGLLDVGRIANSVAGAGVLKPGDIRAPVGHKIGGLGAGKLYGGIDHLHAIKRTVRGFLGRDSHCFFSLNRVSLNTSLVLA